LPQLNEGVSKDEYLARMKTTEGEIELKLFPKQAPLAVENFVTHAKEGYYNGVTFHRVMKGFMIQGGDPQGTGKGGESIWKGKIQKKDAGNGFKNEISNQLYNLRAALAMANAGANTNGSQFFINQNNEDKSDGLLYEDYPEKIIEAYKNGGNPSLDGYYTVFGQVVKGMDVVDKIANAEVKAGENETSENSTPVNPVKIETIEILQSPSK
jgi:peptidyl-prolyl cis-trans isomerase A (cyclophilin A)